MGLDQNWLAIEKEGEVDRSEDDFDNFQYHRKFNALEGFMQDIWYREGNGEEFNCRLLEIDEDILDELEGKIKKDQLEPQVGFFFGSTEKDDWYRKDVEELRDVTIPKARELLEQGKRVFYTSWW